MGVSMRPARCLFFALLLLLPTLLPAALQSTFVASDLRDPMEISIAANGDVYVVEREGRVLRVVPQTGAVMELGTVAVTALRAVEKDSDWAREDGLLGIALDPLFEKNQRLYLYYSAPDKLLNRLSRFTLREGKLDPASEKMLLEIPTDRRNRVCHQAGALQFGKDGLLYLSTGDNTNPFMSAGVAPIDDREKNDHANAMRSAGNTNDLRGKILRIRPTENGYEIPKGNLFPPGTAKTRPEIYVMGCRNPFRMSIDPKTLTIYWGEVGPDARDDSPRGPAGHDEVNQAKAAGNHGWPFLVANNKPYPIFDFETNQIGAMTDAAAPRNPSKRNTGLEVLPAARAAFIWYPYGNSKEFPLVGSGSRNAMAGPVFHYDAKRKHNIFGKEDDRTLITYDWARGKAWKVKLDERENFVSMENLLEGLQHPMDMEMAADGSLVLLEYGGGWYFNKNGRLRIITPDAGNQAPQLSISSSAPKVYQASVKDAENDACVVEWYLTNGVEDRKIGNGMSIALENLDVDQVRAVATDAKGNRSIARVLLKSAQLPELELVLKGTPKQLGFGEKVSFEVKGAGNAKDIVVRARYIPPTGHDAGGPTLSEEVTKLITAKQCIACHQVEADSAGPAYLNVAMRYRDEKNAAAHLRQKLKTGGAGAWGELPMPPQALEESQSQEIIRAILGLAEGMTEVRGSAQGELVLSAAPANAEAGGAWEITAQAPQHVFAKKRVNAK
jgi:cytochrome c